MRLPEDIRRLEPCEKDLVFLHGNCDGREHPAVVENHTQEATEESQRDPDLDHAEGRHHVALHNGRPDQQIAFKPQSEKQDGRHRTSDPRGLLRSLTEENPEWNEPVAGPYDHREPAVAGLQSCPFEVPCLPALREGRGGVPLVDHELIAEAVADEIGLFRQVAVVDDQILTPEQIHPEDREREHHLADVVHSAFGDLTLESILVAAEYTRKGTRGDRGEDAPPANKVAEEVRDRQE